MLTTLFALSLLQSPTMDVHLVRYPDVYGDRIVFTYASDLWVVGMQGGVARRLTSHAGLEYRAKFSPDGKWIAFSGQYDGDTDVYVIPSDGGEPKRLTFNAGTDLVSEWTPDGRIAFVSQREPVRPGSLVLWFVSPNGGLPVKSDVHEAYDVSFSADGRTMAYNRVSSQNFNWRRYRGGTQGKVSFWNFGTKQYSEMATGREQNYYPMWIGDSVYYASDVNQGTLNIYKYDVRSKAKTQVTRFSDADVRWPSSDGRTIVFERNGRLYAMNVANNNVSEVKAQVVSDQLKRRPYFRNVAGFIDGFSLSPSAARMAITARGDLFSVPATNGETRNLSNTQDAREEMPAWSPDGQEIAFVSDKTGERKIYRVPQMGGEWKLLDTPSSQSIAGIHYSPDGKKLGYTTDDNEYFVVDLASGASKLIFKDPQGITSWDWSKDSKWIAYVQTQPSLFNAIYLYDVDNDRHHKVTDGYYNDSSVAFDLNGKYLYFVSARTFGFAPSDFEIGLDQRDTQRIYVVPLKADMRSPLEDEGDEEPVKAASGGGEAAPATQPSGSSIDVEGLGRRAIALPMPPGGYPFVVGANNGVFTYANGGLTKFDLGSKQAQLIVAGATAFDFTPDRSKFAYNFGPNFAISPVRPGIQPGTGRVSMADVNVTIDPVKEWKQMLRDAWQYEKHNFYDKGMLGLDWNAIGQKYIGMAESAGDRTDVNYILGMMIGELGTGHAYVQGGDFGPPIGNPNTGMLGVDFGSSGDSVVLKKVYRGLNFEEARRGPLGAPGVNVKDGDFLLAIDGQTVTAKTDPYSLLVGKAGKNVKIKVASDAEGTNAREYLVTTIGNEQELRYIEWVEDNRKRVEDLSGGKIGYVHVPNTQVNGIVEFMKGYYGQSDKQAFLVDERYNGGGFIPTFFGERLMRKVVTGIQQRHATDIMYPPQTWDGPKAMLINRYAGSGGDHFPWLFKHLGIGPLIGTRTWGGLVGISGGRNLIDGGNVTAPEFALYDIQTGEIIAENKGIDPDIVVDDTPDLVSQGKDPELETAVKWLLDQLAKNPRKPYTKPKFLTGGN
jgi:tricorn protease